MPKRKSIQVDEERQATPTVICQEYDLKMADVVSYLSRTAETYGLFEADWIDQLTKVVIDDFKKNFDDKLQRDLEKERFKALNRITHMILSKYVDALEPDERKAWTEMMGDLKSPDLLDRLSEMELVNIDGKKRLVRLIDGRPDIGTAPENLIPCDEGWHIRGMFCKCRRWRTCELRSEEYIKYKARTDPMYRGLTRKPLFFMKKESSDRLDRLIEPLKRT